MKARNYFNEGLETGKGWNANYRPGGPWCQAAVAQDHKYYQMYLQSLRDSRAWFKGFDEGLEYQKVFRRLQA